MGQGARGFFQGGVVARLRRRSDPEGRVRSWEAEGPAPGLGGAFNRVII